MEGLFRQGRLYISMIDVILASWLSYIVLAVVMNQLSQMAMDPSVARVIVPLVLGFFALGNPCCAAGCFWDIWKGEGHKYFGGKISVLIIFIGIYGIHFLSSGFVEDKTLQKLFGILKLLMFARLANFVL